MSKTALGYQGSTQAGSLAVSWWISYHKIPCLFRSTGTAESAMRQTFIRRCGKMQFHCTISGLSAEIYTYPHEQSKLRMRLSIADLHLVSGHGYHEQALRLLSLYQGTTAAHTFDRGDDRITPIIPTASSSIFMPTANLPRYDNLKLSPDWGSQWLAAHMRFTLSAHSSASYKCDTRRTLTAHKS